MSSKRGSRGAAPPSHLNDQGAREHWPVLVYRLQSHRGWEVYSDPDQEAAASASTPASGKRSAAAKKGATASGHAGGGDGAAPRAVEELTAAPRAGCIEVRKMRLRIQLFQQHKRWDPNFPPRRSGRSGNKENQPPAVQGEGGRSGAEAAEQGGNAENNDDDGSYDADAPGADGWNDNALVVRRKSTLLVTTRRGRGAVMFRFKSTQECVDFCDRLVYLNRDSFEPPRTNDDAGDAASRKRTRSSGDEDCVVNGLDEREQRWDELNAIKRHRRDVIADNAIPAQKLLLASQREEGGFWMKEEAPAMSQEVEESERQEQLMSYIARLAHSEDFRGFVDEIERGLEAAPDTAAIHAALGA